MSTRKVDTAQNINEIESAQGVETVVAHAQIEKSDVVGEKRRPAAGGELVERQFQRRNNINSLPGLIREHGRLIALMRRGEIPLDRAEVMSRAYARHREMVTALEQRTQLEAIQEQLQALRGQPSTQLLLDEAGNRES